jgi:hypothetical protein
MDPSTHSELVKIAEKWLYKTMNCGVVITELVSYANEIPDAFGMRSFYSILIECKTSRSDFFADRKKIFRQMPEQGIGDYRFFLCDEGLIKPEDLPERWGLLWWNGKQVKRIVGPKGNIWSNFPEFKFEKDSRQEYKIFFSALRRVQLRGDLYKIYEPQYDPTAIKNLDNLKTIEASNG